MSILADWAASGAMALTGYRHQPPKVAPGKPATVVREQLSALGFVIPGLLGERAAYAGLRRNAPWSAGGAMRILAALDGHIALTLARPHDLSLIPALVERQVEIVDKDCGWDVVGSWAAHTTADEAAERIQLLGLAGGAILPHQPRPGVITHSLGRRTVRPQPLVIDLTSLWAGPLCAHLLSRLGAEVITVESLMRPDGARNGTPTFYELLHSGRRHLVLDFNDPDEMERLRELISRADLVLEASRPRAMQALGIDAEEVVRSGVSWLSITARGRHSNTVGFGDDVAACAGLVIKEGDAVLPVGDAIADPLTGVAAATAAAAALGADDARLIDVSMLAVTAETVVAPPEHEVFRYRDQWWVEGSDGRFPVADPQVRM